MERDYSAGATDEAALSAAFSDEIRKLTEERGSPPRALIETYGCQQNEADSDKIRGMLLEAGFLIANGRNDADLIILNTCAVREHAELKLLGNVGALKHLKEKNPGLIIGICGCMMQQQKRVDEVRAKYPHVDVVFGPHTLHKLPSILLKAITGGGRVFETKSDLGHIPEGVPVAREGSVKAFVTIMYGCDNFCSYCIVPYLRGREKSREMAAIVGEIRELVKAGYKDITLLGQNVNSYGKGLADKADFADLLREIDKIPGEFWIRFMTSHPKDATKKLIDTMAECDKVAKQLHLPVQAGNDRILALMNRGYTAAEYLELIDYAKMRMPGIALSSDIICGFPGETEEEFEDTVRLIEKVGYDGLFTFIYSQRNMTPAAEMDGQVPYEVKQRRLERLLEMQNSAMTEKNSALIGCVVKVLVEGPSKNDPGVLTARTEGGRLVHLMGDIGLAGKFLDVRITEAKAFTMTGEPV